MLFELWPEGKAIHKRLNDWDLKAQLHDSDVKALLRVVVAWNILLACDISTADFILTSPLIQEEYEIEIPDNSGYLKRKLKE